MVALRKTLEERSAGAIVFAEEGGSRKYLLLHYTTGHWDFPKGNIEKGERVVDTVRREVREETGIDRMAVVSGFRRRIEYYYRRGGALVHKEVEFLLARAQTPGVRISREHLGYQWLGFKEALERVTYQNAKLILRRAEESLNELKSKGELSLFDFSEPADNKPS